MEKVHELVLTLVSSLPPKLDPGWAAICGAAVALLAALIAFLNIGRQARLAFKSLIESQENQARLDREARNEQASLEREALQHRRDIDRQLDAERLELRRRTLASALAGELGALIQQVQNQHAYRASLISLYESATFDKLAEPLRVKQMHRGMIYEAQIAELGMLGPSIAGDVVDVWQFVTVGFDIQTPAVTGPKEAALIFKQFNQATELWMSDATFVHKRLCSLLDPASDDPGTLYEFRKKRDGGHIADVGGSSGLFGRTEQVLNTL